MGPAGNVCLERAEWGEFSSTWIKSKAGEVPPETGALRQPFLLRSCLPAPLRSLRVQPQAGSVCCPPPQRPPCICVGSALSGILGSSSARGGGGIWWRPIRPSRRLSRLGLACSGAGVPAGPLALTLGCCLVRSRPKGRKGDGQPRDAAVDSLAPRRPDARPGVLVPQATD